MISLDEICEDINSRISYPAQGRIKIPIYQSKFKIWVINFLRFFLKNKGYYPTIDTRYPKESRFQPWRIIRPDRWEVIEEKFIAIPKYGIESNAFWRIFLCRSALLYNLEFGTNPPLEVFGGGLPAFIAVKENGTLLHLLNDSSDREGDYAAEDFERLLNNLPCELDWQQLKISPLGNIEPLHYQYPSRKILEIEFTYNFHSPLSRAEQNNISDTFIEWIESHQVYWGGGIDTEKMHGCLTPASNTKSFEDVLAILETFKQKQATLIKRLQAEISTA